MAEAASKTEPKATSQGCPNCDSTAPLVSEFERTGVVQKCASCGFIPRGLRVVPTALASAPVPVPVAAKPIAGDLVSQVRARLTQLDAELTRLESLKRERMQLRRMLRAAEPKR